MKTNLYCICLTIFVSLFVSSCSSPQKKLARGAVVLDKAYQIVSELKKGGHVIYIQHAKTNPMERDSAPKNMENCATQRNLSESGKAQAKLIGDAFVALDIPVFRVYASPYCRCMSTAEIAFGDAISDGMSVIKSFDLKGIKYADRHESERRVNVLINMLSTIPRKTDKNTILVSHAENIKKAVGYSMSEGDALVVLPMEQEGFKVIAFITSGQWEDIAHTIGVKIN